MNSKKIVVSQVYLEQRYAEDRAYEQFKLDKVEDEKREVDEKDRAKWELENAKQTRARRLHELLGNHPNTEVQWEFDVYKLSPGNNLDEALERLEALAKKCGVVVPEDDH